MLETKHSYRCPGREKQEEAEAGPRGTSCLPCWHTACTASRPGSPLPLWPGQDPAGYPSDPTTSGSEETGQRGWSSPGSHTESLEVNRCAGRKPPRVPAAGTAIRGGTPTGVFLPAALTAVLHPPWGPLPHLARNPGSRTVTLSCAKLTGRVTSLLLRRSRCWRLTRRPKSAGSCCSLFLLRSNFTRCVRLQKSA